MAIQIMMNVGINIGEKSKITKRSNPSMYASKILRFQIRFLKRYFKTRKPYILSYLVIV